MKTRISSGVNCPKSCYLYKENGEVVEEEIFIEMIKNVIERLNKKVTITTIQVLPLYKMRGGGNNCNKNMRSIMRKMEKTLKRLWKKSRVVLDQGDHIQITSSVSNKSQNGDTLRRCCENTTRWQTCRRLMTPSQYIIYGWYQNK